MTFRLENRILSLLLSLTGIGPFPVHTKNKNVARFFILYERLLCVTIDVAVVSLIMAFVVSLNFVVHTSLLLIIANIIITSSVHTLCSFQTPAKQIRMKKCRRLLKEIHDRFPYNDFGMKKSTYIITYILWESIIHCTYIQFVWNDRLGRLPWIGYVSVIHLLQHYICILYMIQFLCFVRNIYEALLVLNFNLKMIRGIYCDRVIINNFLSPTNPKELEAFALQNKIFSTYWYHKHRTSLDHVIRHTAVSYLKLCKILRLTNTYDGTCLWWLTIILCINILSGAYNLLLEITNLNTENIVVLLPVLWTVSTVGRLILLADQCHRIHDQMEYVQRWIILLKCSYSLTNMAVRNELELFQRLVVLNRPTLSPQDKFTYSRTFAAKVIGAIITLLVIIITYGKEVKNV